MAGNNKSGSITSYIKSLGDRLAQATQDLDHKEQVYQRLNAESGLLTTKITFLQDSLNKIKHTNELAKAIILLLKQKNSLVRRMACNANLTKDAITILVLNTEGVAVEAHQLKFLIQKLIDAIKTTDCDLNENGAVMTAINNVKTKIEEALTNALDCTQKALEALQRAYVVEYFLGDLEGESFGLTKAMYDLLALIDVNSGPRTVVKFPREDCPADCYEYLIGQLGNAQGQLLDVTQQRSEAEKERDLTQAKVDAIKDSKEAAEAAGNCDDNRSAA